MTRALMAAAQVLVGLMVFVLILGYEIPVLVLFLASAVAGSLALIDHPEPVVDEDYQRLLEEARAELDREVPVPR